MQTYIDAISYLNQAIAKLTKLQSQQLCQFILSEVVNQLPTDWIDNELAAEKPYYLQLAALIQQGQWQADDLESVLIALDDIMTSLAGSYPHSTATYPLSLLGMVDNYLQLLITTQDYQSFAIGVVDEYLNLAEYKASQKLISTNNHDSKDNNFDNNKDIDIDIDQWLTYPDIKQAFDQINTWLTVIKVNKSE